MILKILVNFNYIIGLIKYIVLLFKSTDPEAARKLKSDLQEAKKAAYEKKDPSLIADIINNRK